MLTGARFAEATGLEITTTGVTTELCNEVDADVAAPVPSAVVSALFTVTVNVPVEPVPVGVPEITPVEVLKFRPAGSVPVSVYVNGAVPVVGAGTVYVYGWPITGAVGAGESTGALGATAT